MTRGSMPVNKSRLLLAMANECMSTKEVCEKSGVSKPTFTKVKSGKINPQPVTLGKIAKALNVTPEYLVDWDESNSTGSETIV